MVHRADCGRDTDRLTPPTARRIPARDLHHHTISTDCTLGTLAPGTSTTVTVTVESAATGALSDTATVDAIESDLESANNTDTATTTVSNARGCTII